jgi:hypothetical protein
VGAEAAWGLKSTVHEVASGYMRFFGFQYLVTFRFRPVAVRDQLRDQRGQGPRIWPPFAPWVQVGAGMGWLWSGGSNFAPGPLGSVAGDPDRHRGWLLCPPAVPAAAGRG